MPKPNATWWFRCSRSGSNSPAFEPKIVSPPADVAQAARDYVAARRAQMQSLADRSYTPADGTAVDTALGNLNRLCGIVDNGSRI